MGLFISTGVLPDESFRFNIVCAMSGGLAALGPRLISDEPSGYNYPIAPGKFDSGSYSNSP